MPRKTVKRRKARVYVTLCDVGDPIPKGVKVKPPFWYPTRRKLKGRIQRVSYR